MRVAAAARGWDDLLAGDDTLAAMSSKRRQGRTARQRELKAKPNKGRVTPAHPFFAVAQALLDLRDQTAAMLARAAAPRAAARPARRRQRRRCARPSASAASSPSTTCCSTCTSGSRAAHAPGLAGVAARALPGGADRRVPGHRPAAVRDLRRDLRRHTACRSSSSATRSRRSTAFATPTCTPTCGARDRPSARYTLADNQRSSEPLIDALNGLFGANDRGLHARPAWPTTPVGFGDKPREAFVDTHGAPRAPLQVWTAAGRTTAAAARESATRADAAMRHCAAEIARLRRGRAARRDHARRRSRCAPATSPCSCAPTRRAARMRDALALLGVGSVELSRASVYRQQRRRRARARARRDPRAARASGCCAPRSPPSWIGLDAAAIAALATTKRSCSIVCSASPPAARPGSRAASASCCAS